MDKEKTRNVILVAGSVFEEDASRFLCGIADAVTDAEARLIVFSGDAFLESSPNKALPDDISGFAFLDPDAFIIEGFSRRIRRPPSFLKSIAKVFKEARVICAGFKCEGFPCMEIDRKAGYTGLFSHIFGIHGKRRVALILGREDAEENEEATDAYYTTMGSHGVAGDPSLVIFTGKSDNELKAAIKSLLCIGGAGLDAVVMGSGIDAGIAVSALSSSGLSVPGGLIAASLGPSSFTEDAMRVTSVYMPLYRSGREAASMALSRRGFDDAAQAMLHGRLVTGSTCGCENPFAHWLAGLDDPAGGEGPAASEVDALFAELTEWIGFKEWIAPLIACVTRPESGIGSEKLSGLAASYAGRMIRRGGNSMILAALLTEITRKARSFESHDGILRDAYAAMEREERKALAEHEKAMILAHEVRIALDEADDLDEIESIITERLPAFGFISPVLCACEDMSILKPAIDELYAQESPYHDAQASDVSDSWERITAVFELQDEQVACGYLLCRLERKTAPVCGYVIRLLGEALARVMRAKAGECIPDARANIDEVSAKYSLTRRETEVLALVACGLMNKEIGIRLGITLKTVEGHIGSAFQKLSVENRIGLLQKLAEP